MWLVRPPTNRKVMTWRFSHHQPSSTSRERAERTDSDTHRGRLWTRQKNIKNKKNKRIICLESRRREREREREEKKERRSEGRGKTGEGKKKRTENRPLIILHLFKEKDNKKMSVKSERRMEGGGRRGLGATYFTPSIRKSSNGDYPPKTFENYSN